MEFLGGFFIFIKFNSCFNRKIYASTEGHIYFGDAANRMCIIRNPALFPKQFFKEQVPVAWCVEQKGRYLLSQSLTPHLVIVVLIF